MHNQITIEFKNIYKEIEEIAVFSKKITFG